MLRFASSLRFRLILLAMFILLPAFALLLYFGDKEMRLADERARDSIRTLALTVSADMRGELDGARTLLLGIAEIPAMRRQDGPPSPTTSPG